MDEVRDLWSEGIGALVDYHKAAGHAARTVETRSYWAERLRADVSDQRTLSEVTRMDLLAWLGHDSWGPSTRKNARQSVVSLFRASVSAGLIESNPALDLPTVRVPKGVPRPVDSVVFNTAMGQAEGRYRLALLLAARAGLRRNEIVQVRTTDLMGSGLLVRGKGGKTRFVPLDSEVRSLISQSPGGYVFASRWHGSAEHMNVDALGKGIRRALGWRSSAHPLRHRFATRAYRGTHDLRAVQELLGHESPATTAVYTQVQGEALLAAVEAAA